MGDIVGCEQVLSHVKFVKHICFAERHQLMQLDSSQMRSGWLIREARLRAGLTQTELAERAGRDRAVIARWEQEVVAPSMETLVDLVRACGFDLPLVLVPYDTGRDERLESNLNRSPERRLEQLLSTLSSSGRKRG